MRRIISVVVVGGLAVTGCGGGSGIDCPNYVPDREYGPVVLGPIDDQTRLRDDGQVLIAYGAAHEDAYGGVRFYNTAEESRLEIGFAEDLNEHCWAVRELVAFPESLDVVPVSYSLEDLRGAARAAEEAGALPKTVGVSHWGSVGVYVPADALDVAERLHDQWGDALELNVGGWPYPPPDIEGVPEVCEPIAESSVQLPLEAAFVPLDGPIGAAVSANEHPVTITVTNAGPEMIIVSAGLQTLPLFRSGEDTAAAFFTGSVDGWAALGELEPGESREFRGAIGVTPCALDNGYLLTPGIYELRGPFEYSHENQHYVMLVDPITVTVTE